MKVREFLKKMGMSIGVSKPEPRLAESYYKVQVEKEVKGFKGPQKVLINDPTSVGYTMTLTHPKTRTPVTLPHFTAPRRVTPPTGEEFIEFLVQANSGDSFHVGPVSSNLLVLKHWLGEGRYSELMACGV